MYCPDPRDLETPEGRRRAIEQAMAAQDLWDEVDVPEGDRPVEVHDNEPEFGDEAEASPDVSSPVEGGPPAP